MKLRMQIQSAITNIIASKLRSILAILGILVGTASVVAMVSGGELATQQTLAQFKTLGTDLLSVSINDDSNEKKDASKKQELDLKTVAAMKTVSNEIENVAPYTNSYFTIYFGNQEIDGGVLGVTKEFAATNRVTTSKGRFISTLDKHTYFCVIGNGIFQKIKQLTANPIGKQIRIGKNYFTIVGVLNESQENSFVYSDLNNSIFIPIDTALTLSTYTNINNIILKLKPNSNISQIEETLKSFINKNVSGKQLYFRDPKEIIKSMEKQREILTIFLGFIGSIALLVGGIGIMNIMLVSVSERRREIGIRLAIGAKRKDIQKLFLIESIILSVFGGALGVLFGIFISFVIAEARHWGFTLYLAPPIIGFAVSVFTGIFFGFYPAYKASKLDPIETLRSE